MLEKIFEFLDLTIEILSRTIEISVEQQQTP